MKVRYYWSFKKDSETYDQENWDVSSCIEEAKQYNENLDNVHEVVYVAEKKTNLPKLSNVTCYNLKTGKEVKPLCTTKCINHIQGARSKLCKPLGVELQDENGHIHHYYCQCPSKYREKGEV